MGWRGTTGFRLQIHMGTKSDCKAVNGGRVGQQGAVVVVSQCRSIEDSEWYDWDFL